jgi:UDP-N-acetylglucosamine 2-epimerase (non-hydrolysing)
LPTEVKLDQEEHRRPKIICAGGTRPNFVKLAPVVRALLESRLFEVKLVHTGQHRQEFLGKDPEGEFGLPRPDYDLIGLVAAHARQTARIMEGFEGILDVEQPHVVLVVGDVNTTLGCAIAASKFRLDQPFPSSLGARWRPLVAHVEAGLRSFDNDMPEETNRRLVDCVSDLYFASEQSAVDNLRSEGVKEDSIAFVGSTTVDAVCAVLSTQRFQQSSILERLQLREARYGVVTLHRPENVDTEGAFAALLAALDPVSEEVQLVFPVHPRTAAKRGIDRRKNWRMIVPLPYWDFIRLVAGAAIVLTDSGGVQEESTWLDVPCLTLRESTERPVTVERGTNTVVGRNPTAILTYARRALLLGTSPRPIQYWDGNASSRIVGSLRSALSPVLGEGG